MSGHWRDDILSVKCFSCRERVSRQPHGWCGCIGSRSGTNCTTQFCCFRAQAKLCAMTKSVLRKRVLGIKTGQNFLGVSAPGAPTMASGYPFSDVRPRQDLGVVVPQSCYVERTYAFRSSYLRHCVAPSRSVCHTPSSLSTWCEQLRREQTSYLAGGQDE